ncbi:DNA topoisomerase 1, partial [Ascosphaera aggregata]
MRDALISANGTKRSASPANRSSSSDDDVPLTDLGRSATTIASSHQSKRRRTSPKAATVATKSSPPSDPQSSDSDVPVAKELAAMRAKIEKQQEKDSRDIIAKESAAFAKAHPAPRQRKPAVKEEELSSSDDDIPLARKRKKTLAAPTNAKPAVTKKKGAPAATTATAKTGAKTKFKKERVKEEEYISAKEESPGESTGVHWWENPDAVDDSIKWTTLEHNGVVFPPPYEPLPKNVKLVYDGQAVDLAIEAEEVATFFGCMLNSTVNVENPVFQKNFFNDFRAVLKKTGGAKDSKGNKVDIKDFKKCDFTRIFEHYDSLRKARNARPAAEKKKEREKKEEIEAPYKYCIWDGKKQQVGNFHIEPPGLFRGRGEHPKTGKVKQRVRPEQITINIGKEAKVPPPPEGHRWKEIKHDQKAAWLASWQENINGDIKYVQLAANSD